MPKKDEELLATKLVETTHPHLIEMLLVAIDGSHDFYNWLCEKYEEEWPERAEQFFETSSSGKRAG